MYTKYWFSSVLCCLMCCTILHQLSAQPLPEQLLTRLDSLPRVDSMPQNELQRWGILLAGRTSTAQQWEAARLSAIQQQRDSLATAIEVAKTDTTMDKKLLRSWSKDLKGLQSDEKDATQRVSAAVTRLEQCSRYNIAEMETQRGLLPPLWQTVHAAENDLRRKFGPRPAATTDSTALGTAPALPAVAYATYAVANDVLYNPPVPSCRWAVNERDAFSGEVRRETEKAVLFRYTNPNLRNLFGKKPQTVCEASLAQTGEVLRLNLVFTINDPNARNAFGSLTQNSAALFKLLDGSTLTLANTRADEGAPTADKSGYTYKGQYLIDKNTLKRFQKIGLDKLRLTWATGYEDYDVQQVDLLQRTLGCFN